MINFVLHPKKGDWEVFCFIENFSDSEISFSLLNCGAKEQDLNRLLQKYRRGAKNGGFTFSNIKDRVSVVAVYHSTSISQLLNSLIHEFRHLERHICKVDGIDPYSEGASYLAGDIVGEVAKNLFASK